MLIESGRAENAKNLRKEFPHTVLIMGAKKFRSLHKVSSKQNQLDE